MHRAQNSCKEKFSAGEAGKGGHLLNPVQTFYLIYYIEYIFTYYGIRIKSMEENGQEWHAMDMTKFICYLM